MRSRARPWLVNTLEQRTAVRLAAEVVEIRRMLEEREERLGTKRLIVRRATCVV
jgi:hypothetical protein